MVLRISSACQRGTRAVRGRRLCDRSGRICIGQGTLATPGCGELINLGKLVSGLEVAVFEFVSGACG